MTVVQLQARLNVASGGTDPRRNHDRRRSDGAVVLSLVLLAGFLYVQPAGTPRITFSQGSLMLGATGAGKGQLQISNSGSAPLYIGAVKVTGSADFSVPPDCDHKALAPGATCILWISFAPKKPGEYQAELVIPNNSDNGTPMVALRGSVDSGPVDSGPPLRDNLSVEPDELRFNTQEGGPIDYLRTITISNPRGAPIQLLGIDVTVGIDDFVLDEFALSKCQAELDARENCVVRVKFTGKGQPPHRGTLRVQTKDTRRFVSLIWGSG